MRLDAHFDAPSALRAHASPSPPRRALRHRAAGAGGSFVAVSVSLLAVEPCSECTLARSRAVTKRYDRCVKSRSCPSCAPPPTHRASFLHAVCPLVTTVVRLSLHAAGPRIRIPCRPSPSHLCSSAPCVLSDQCGWRRRRRVHAALVAVTDWEGRQQPVDSGCFWVVSTDRPVPNRSGA